MELPRMNLSQWKAIVELLVAMGYDSFKLVAQSVYSMRCWPYRCAECPGRCRSFVSAGPPGPLAVDVAIGNAWHARASLLSLLRYVVLLETYYLERFDLHARRPVETIGEEQNPRDARNR